MKRIVLFEKLDVNISDEDWFFLCKARFFSNNPPIEDIEAEFVSGTGITPNKRKLWVEASNRFHDYIADLRDIMYPSHEDTMNILTRKYNNYVSHITDKAIDDMGKGNELPIDDAFKMVGVILEQRKSVKERKSLDKTERQHFIIEDIRHTGHHGEKGTSKIGEKYDRRRGHKIYLYAPLEQYEQFKGESIMLMDGDSEDEDWFIMTTPLVEIREQDVYVELETLNSIYILRRTSR